MGVSVPVGAMRGRANVARLAIGCAALWLLGVGATVFAPTAQAGSGGEAPRLAQLAGYPPVAPVGAPAPPGPQVSAQAIPVGAPAPPAAAPVSAQAVPVGVPAPQAALPPGGPVPQVAPAFSARPGGSPPTAPAPALPLPLPVPSPEPHVRVVLAPDARGPLPPAVAMPASQVPANAMVPASAHGGSSGTLSLASMGAPATGSSPGRVEAGPSAAMRIVSVAQSQLGARYVWGGTTPAGGFDCSGFVYWAFSQVGHALPRVMTDQFASGRRVRVEELQPGDVLFYQNTYTAGLSHNGIYVGDGKFIHAADESTGVVLTPVRSAYWEQHFAGAIRVLD
jgi:cell wall-associated NlpC family hydrolase